MAYARPQQPVRQNQGGLIQFAAHQLKREFPHLAKGSYGIVFKGTAAGIHGQVVIKDLEIHVPNAVPEWQKEVDLMARTKNDYVAKIYGYATTNKILTIVMEFMPNGSLYDQLHVKKTKLSLLHRMRMARHCCLGLAFIHSEGVLHRDVKSMNILVAADFSCKYTDFGSARKIGSKTGQQVPAQCLMTQNSGTPLWMAPEVKMGGHYDYSADIYSLGLVLYEIFELKLPYWDQRTARCLLPQRFQSSDLVLPCVNVNPMKRPKARELVYQLDAMIRQVIKGVLQSLPQNEQMSVLGHYTDLSNNQKVEEDLTVLYKYLLQSKKHDEVNTMIARVYSQGASQPLQVNNSNNHLRNSYNTPPPSNPQVQRQPQPHYAGSNQIPYGRPHVHPTDFNRASPHYTPMNFSAPPQQPLGYSVQSNYQRPQFNTPPNHVHPQTRSPDLSYIRK
mmetsp:Transcript_24575/g.27336  ORF Transcript_24575/g.27336 Transcript_24575/m.27336 type:complete len:446 (+) Transcript_24575:69-1406(+)